MPRPTVAMDGGATDDVVAIERLFTGLEDAFHRQDADAFDARFSADAVQVTAAGQELRGWDEIHAYHRERLQGHTHGLRVDLDVVNAAFLSTEVAVVHTLQTTTAPGGERRNAGTWTLAKRGGDWWIFAAHQTNVVDLPLGWGAAPSGG